MAAPQRMTSTATSNMSAAFATTRINARIVAMKLCLGSGIVLGLLGASLLVAFGVLYVKPYVQVKNMVQTDCVMSNTSLESELVQCQCDDDGDECISSYPCLSVTVNYTRRGGSLVADAILYDSQETFVLQHSAQQCSYHACDRSLSDNIKAVRKFSERYDDRRKSFDCFYNPDDAAYVLVDVVTTSDVVHAMLWPGLAFITGAIILSVYIFDIGFKHVATPLSGSPFNSLEKPWLRNQQRNYEKVATLSEYNAENAAERIEDNDAHVQTDIS